MGLLVDGEWHDRWYDTAESRGRFERSEAKFRNWITPDGAPGPSGSGGFRAQAGRYHLYVSYACPWAHRTLIYRLLKGLEPMIGVSVVSPLMGAEGWVFATDFPQATGDRLYHLERLYELYLRADAGCSGRVTVPVLWDTQQETIVSNESAEIIRMFNSAFDGVGATPGDYYPPALRAQIDAWNTAIYNPLNNGVYRCGFATTQDAYDEAVGEVFAALDSIERQLGQSRYLTGNRLTEADIRLWPTLVRFDAVYVTHFKCDHKRIADYPNIEHYLRDIYQLPGIAGTVDLAHIRHHYFRSHESVNPHRIVSRGPDLDFGAPHDRDRLGPRVAAD